jgi:hypothetical protein
VVEWSEEDRARGDRLERALAARLYGSQADEEPLLATLDADEVAEAARTVREMIRARSHRGTRGIADWYPCTLAGPLDELIGRFSVSGWCGRWRELPAGEPGLSLEEALYRFFVDEQMGDPDIREEEFLGAIVRALAVAPCARFVWPPELHAAPGGCFAISRNNVLHAAIDG